jgi:fatty acid desaturase
MRQRMKENLFILMAAVIVAVVFLKLTYVAVLTLAAIVKTLLVVGIMLFGTFYCAKRLLSNS